MALGIENSMKLQYKFCTYIIIIIIIIIMSLFKEETHS